MTGSPLPVHGCLVVHRGCEIPHPTGYRGVLFLDEFPEFGATALEALRKPLESGSVTISRARGSVTFPARVLLVAAI